MSSTPQNLIQININGRPLSVPPGTNAIEAARLIDTEIPHYCYHPKLSIVGNCRMCLIEIGTPSLDPATRQPILNPDGSPKINWNPKPQIGCATNASPGLHIRTHSPLVEECRKGVTEFLLINHPLDCPICDQAGECKLQEQSLHYGAGSSRYIEPKNTKPKRSQLGPRITLDDERCILCSRCIRFCNEIIKDPVLGFTERGSHSTLGCYPGRQFDSNYSLNTVDICPVGALTSTDFRFKMRTWFLKQTPSICTESSTGVNTTIWSREGVIYRITPRQNDAVNSTWMPDSGRLLYKQVNSPDRLVTTTAPIATLLQSAAQLLQNNRSKIAIIASAHSTVEEQFLLKQIASNLNAPLYTPLHKGSSDNFLISDDPTPNTAGAKLLQLNPVENLFALSADIDTGAITTLLVHHEDITTSGISTNQLSKLNIIHLGTRKTGTSTAAQIQIPTHTVFEKSGAFINKTNRLQKFSPAIPAPTTTLNDLSALSTLLSLIANTTGTSTTLGTTAPSDSASTRGSAAEESYSLVASRYSLVSTTPDQLWPIISDAIPALSTITSLAAIPDTGHQLA